MLTTVWMRVEWKGLTLKDGLNRTLQNMTCYLVTYTGPMRHYRLLLLIYSVFMHLTPSNRVLLVKVMIKKFPAFFPNSKIPYRVQKNTSLDPILRQMSSATFSHPVSLKSTLILVSY
jgi:hypothetical protein